MSRKNDDNTALDGVCRFFSETGTEGGYWAFQDARYIKFVDKKSASRLVCAKCNLYWDKNTNPNSPLKVTRSVPLAEALRPDFVMPKPCANDAHDFQPVSEEEWSDDGLHVLGDGDNLTIYDKENPSKIVWTGTIELRQYDLFTEEACGFWIHADQEGVDRKIWATYFFEQYPAKLIKAKK